MANSDPRDRFVYPYLTLMSDSYNASCFYVLIFKTKGTAVISLKALQPRHSILSPPLFLFES